LDESDSFKLRTMTLDGSIMDVLDGGVTVKMKGVPYIKSIIVNPASTVNSAITSYTFLVTPTVPINNSYSIIFKFPPEIKLPSDQSLYKCSSDDVNLISQIVCVNHFAFVTNGVRAVVQIKAPLTGINPLQTFKITINNI
jgi:hypothetical protein